MKKLDVYVEEFKTAPTPKEGIKKVLEGMFFEIGEEIRLRNARENAAVCAIFDEQDNRWRAFLKRIGLERASEKTKDGLLFVVQESMPEAFALYKRHKENRQFVLRAQAGR